MRVRSCVNMKGKKKERRERRRDGRREGGQSYLDGRLRRVQELELQRRLLASGNHGLAQLDCACSSLGPVVGHDGGKGTGGQGGRLGGREGVREGRISGLASSTAPAPPWDQWSNVAAPKKRSEGGREGGREE